ncbi:hypothetical protein [Paenibacillus harenae]|uniref:hypothetical protein n=1 Tax=Paenibacillus harenae TaxID=306543 RepID=UPI0027900A60|nr:hypothetical protein [Paenibacillus harenae]MDQ0060753.1 hypothetical protein [Paenibacillus harenae]
MRIKILIPMFALLFTLSACGKGEDLTQDINKEISESSTNESSSVLDDYMGSYIESEG